MRLGLRLRVAAPGAAPSGGQAMRRRLRNRALPGWLMIAATLGVAACGAGADGRTAAGTISGQGGQTGALSSGASSLRVEGNRLVDARGQTVVLHGVDRSGTEYACIQGWAIFDGPSDAASVAAIASWQGVNAVRVPLNEDCWLGINGVDPAYGGVSYQLAIERYVDLLRSYGLYVILDLHWVAPGTTPATQLEPMPDQDHSPAFWTSVATAFRRDPEVIFDLFNEPFPDGNQDSAAAWTCLLEGGSCAGLPYQAAGMQELVNAVRSTGASNILMVPGVQYSNDLDGWLTHRPTDPLGQLAASFHGYSSNNCVTASCWDAQLAPVAASIPLISGEIGENDGGTGFIDAYMSWADHHQLSYLAWTWDAWGCDTGNVLITSYTGAACSPFGTDYRTHVASQQTSAPKATPAAADMVAPMPIISTRLPAYASAGKASAADDGSYDTAWQPGSSSGWLAYDLSSVAPARRGKVVVAWYTDSYGYTVGSLPGVCQGWEGGYPTSYTIDANPAPGGTLPTSGWVTLVAVSGNLYKSRQDLLDLAGYNWIRLSISSTQSSATSGSPDISINSFEVAAAAAGVTDDWVFLGDSITAGAMDHSTIDHVASFADLIAAGTGGANHPIQENAGLPCVRADQVDGFLGTLLAMYPSGTYVAITLGTNDAWNGAGVPSLLYTAMASIVQEVLAAGDIPVVATIPWPNTTPAWQADVASLNAQLVKLLSAYPHALTGPDFYSYFQEHPSLIPVGNVHPTTAGYAAMRQLWAETALHTIYG